MVAFLLRFFPYVGPFSPCEVLFNHVGSFCYFFSMWGAFFDFIGEGGGLSGLVQKISAGAHSGPYLTSIAVVTC